MVGRPGLENTSESGTRSVSPYLGGEVVHEKNISNDHGDEQTGEDEDEMKLDDKESEKLHESDEEDETQEWLKRWASVDEKKDEDEEIRHGRIPRQPKVEEIPSQEEVEKHMIAHETYENWCPHCVKGSAEGKKHDTKEWRTKLNKEVDSYGIDYAFFVEESKNKRDDDDEDNGMPIIVGKESMHGIMTSDVVPVKGTDPYTIKRTGKNIDLTGMKKLIFKSDSDHSIVALKQRIKAEASQEIILEEAPVGDHKANGMTENAVQQFKSKFRTRKDGLEAKYNKTNHENHPCIPWLVQHTAKVINWYRIGRGGKTAYERMKGNAFDREIT